MAAVTVGELAVELEVKSAEFRSELREAGRRIDRFERGAKGGTARAGASFRGLIGPILAVGGALAAIGGVRLFTGLGASAVRTAASFEGFEVRLKALLGTQGDANAAFRTFLELSTRTPFAVEQIVGGATTLAAVALGNRKSLEELTATAANLAAVTGLGFSEAAGNLQRALAGGIGAADLFRERGVRQLIESVTGIPNLLEVPLDQLRAAFVEVFGPGPLARFGTAAEDLSQTLAGSLSNIGDALSRFRAALGDALAPAVIGAARGVIIPFFGDLQAQVEDNKEALQDFFIEGFANAVGAVRELLRALGPLAAGIVSVVRDSRSLGSDLALLLRGINIFVSSIANGLRTLETGLNAVGLALRVIAFELGQRTADEVEEQLTRFNESQGRLIDGSFELEKLLKGVGDGAEAQARGSVRVIDRLVASLEGAEDRVRSIGAETQRLARERAAAPEGGPAAAPALVVDREALKASRERRLNIEKVALAEGRIGAILEGRTLGPDDEQLEAFSVRLGGALTEGLGDSLKGVLSGEGQSFAEGLAETSSRLFEASMSSALEDLQAGADDLFANLGSSLASAFPGTGSAEGFAGALGAAAGIAGQLVASQIAGTSSSASAGMVDSIVTSTQAVRGVVAGPSSIPIAQVGNAIRDANAETLREARRGNTILEQILSAVRTLDVSGITTGEDLAAAIAAEFNASPALG